MTKRILEKYNANRRLIKELTEENAELTKEIKGVLDTMGSCIQGQFIASYQEATKYILRRGSKKKALAALAKVSGGLIYEELSVSSSFLKKLYTNEQIDKNFFDKQITKRLVVKEGK